MYMGDCQGEKQEGKGKLILRDEEDKSKLRVYVWK
jgi:hypothetical protein